MMEIIKLILMMILVLGLIIAIPSLIAILIYRLINKWKGKRIAIIVSSLIPLSVVYWIITAIFPSNSFYKIEYNDITGLILPKSAKIKWKNASYPDFHGDYCSAAIIELDSNDYKSLINSIEIKHQLNDTILIYSSQYEGVVHKINDKIMIRKFSKQIDDQYYFIGFYNDNKTIIIHKIQN